MRRFTRSPLAVSALLVALAALPARAQAPVELVTDLHQAPAYGLGSLPIFVASDGARSWFWVLGTDEITDLWTSDGTPSGTQLLLADVAPANTMVQEHFLGGIVLPNGRAVFIAPTGGFPASGIYGDPTGSDGTAGGSAVLDDGQPFSLRATGGFAESGGEAWFCARDSSAPGGAQHLLWRTDGTPAGTRRAFAPGVPAPALVRGDVVAGGGHVWFTSLTGEVSPGSPSTVWRTDGSGGPPTQVFATPPDHRVELCGWLPASGRVLAAVETVFGAPALDPEWWAIGPTGGVKLADAAIAGARWCVANGPTTYFVGRVGAGPTQLFATDGTPAGTFAVPDNAQLLSNAVADQAGTAYGAGLVCLAWNPAVGFEPTYVDRNGMTLLADTEPGPASAYVSAFVEHAGELYFHARQGPATPGPLFRTDGSPVGTQSIPGADQVGSGPLWPTGRTQAGPLYAFDDGSGIGSEVWRADAGSIALVGDLTVNSTASAGVVVLTAFGPRLVLSASDGTAGIEPWITDGTAAGTTLLSDLDPGFGSSFPSPGVSAGGTAAFVALGAEFGTELVLTDGTTAGTAVVDLAPGPTSSHVANLTASDRHIYFDALGAAPGLWRTDGTPRGTELVAAVTVAKEFGTTTIFDAAGVGGAAVFFVGVDAGGAELWRSDGTAAGTWRVLDLRVGAGSSDPRDGVAVDGRFFFSANNGLFGREVWVTDGTAAGTTLVVDLAPLSASGVAASGAIGWAGAYVVGTPAAAVPSGPVAIDAATLAVRQLVDPALSGADPLLAGAATGGYRATSGGLLFSTVDPTAPSSRARLWRTVGPGAFASPLATPIAAGLPLRAADAGAGRVLFAGVGPAGVEPWIAGGGAADGLLADLFPGLGSSDPGWPLRLGAELVFAANDPAFGRELFRTTVATVGAHVVAPLGGGCAQSGSPATLSGVGEPVLGADFDVRLEGAAPLAPVVWAADIAWEPAPLSGPCQALLPNPVAVALGFTDPAGVALLDLAVPANPLLLDRVVVFQALVVEVPGPYLGISSLSDGLEIVVGP